MANQRTWKTALKAFAEHRWNPGEVFSLQQIYLELNGAT
jgi:hypothetical protein